MLRLMNNYSYVDTSLTEGLRSEHFLKSTGIAWLRSKYYFVVDLYKKKFFIYLSIETSISLLRKRDGNEFLNELLTYCMWENDCRYVSVKYLE